MGGLVVEATRGDGVQRAVGNLSSYTCKKLRQLVVRWGVTVSECNMCSPASYNLKPACGPAAPWIQNQKTYHVTASQPASLKSSAGRISKIRCEAGNAALPKLSDMSNAALPKLADMLQHHSSSDR